MAFNASMVMNHSPQEVEEIGGIRYLYKYLGVYLPYMILMSVGTVAGIIGIVWKQKALFISF